MTILRTKRLSNPRKVVVLGKPASSRKRKMSPKQVKFFGTKRQRVALKAKNKSKRNVERGFYNATGFHPLRRSRDYDPDRSGDDYGAKTDGRGFKKKKSNPSLVVTLGPVMNPHKRSSMPATKRKTNKKRSVASNRRRVAKNAHRPRTKRRTRTITKTVVRYRTKPNKRRKRSRNPRTVVVMKRNTRRRRTARNPSLFGSSLTSKQGLMILGGGFTGLVAAKFIPTLLPTSMTGSLGASGGGRFVLTLGSAIAAAWAAGKFATPAFADGVLFGGLIQAGSVALNAFLPGVYSSLGIGLGDLLPGSFTVPQNPIRAGMAPAALPAPKGASGGQARVTMNGLARAYGNAF
jgi:hypothetical protein